MVRTARLIRDDWLDIVMVTGTKGQLGDDMSKGLKSDWSLVKGRIHNVVSPSFASPTSNITRYIDQPSANSSPTLDELPDGTEFPSDTVGSHDVATLPSPYLPPQGHSDHEILTPVELSSGIQVPPETINSRDAAASPSPSLPPQSSFHPQIVTASASTPVLASPLKSFWKRFPMFNGSAASVDSRWWKFPRIGSITYASPFLYEYCPEFDP
ncbi:uncharacterized protein F5147DRAFT_781926 [Suillus discolor]|uniref:Uncharacterized protein n=1 Tax=Suillus discolor TaxID=1912936 RepID=A0A9P7ESI0_9AGAM|nr:uncharacterized protein F5147DRAFT_781926 [Suillus discolor]KAG2085714.1 hypothetical protein F5147DRAFT_781926 [Suillus discolor]